MTLDRKVSPRELAERWGWSLDRVYALIHAHGLPVIRIGRRWFVEEAALETWLAARRSLPTSTQTDRRPVSLAAECEQLGVSLEVGGRYLV